MLSSTLSLPHFLPSHPHIILPHVHLPFPPLIVSLLFSLTFISQLLLLLLRMHGYVEAMPCGVPAVAWLFAMQCKARQGFLRSMDILPQAKIRVLNEQSAILVFIFSVYLVFIFSAPSKQGKEQKDSQNVDVSEHYGHNDYFYLWMICTSSAL